MLKMCSLIWITMFRSGHLGLSINNEKNRESTEVHSLKFS